MGKNRSTQKLCACVLLMLSSLSLLQQRTMAQQSQPNPAASFFPLQIGNTWVMWGTAGPGADYYKTYVVSDTVRRQNRLYYVVNLSGPRYFREDSVGGFYEYRDSCEVLLMDFSKSSPDTMTRTACFQGYTIRLYRKAVVTFTGEPGDQLEFVFDYSLPVVDEEQWLTLEEGVGPVAYRPQFDIYEYVRAVKINGRVFGDTTLITSVNDKDFSQMNSYHLHQNYPNPFNTSTVISFDLNRPEPVTCEIYTLAGRKVRSIFQNIPASGRHLLTWDGRDDAGRDLPSGIYFYRLITDEFLQHKKVVLVR